MNERERKRQEALANRNRQIENKSETKSEDESSDESSLILQVCSLKQSTNNDHHNNNVLVEYNNNSNDVVVELEAENQRLKSKEMLADFLAIQKVIGEGGGTGEDAYDPLSVDDTDDPLDPVELAAWKLRELQRIQSEHNEHTSPINNTIDNADTNNDTKTSSSKFRFLQKYYHKGAFYTDDPILKKRDYAEVVERDRIDRDTLPGVLQVRDFGKKGRSKWTHLTKEDTTVFDYGWGAKSNYDENVVSKMAGHKN